jgi:UDP-N-acetyl-D-mannosaminuronate dehydrogenase
MNYKNLSNYDAIIISTNHDSDDYKNILKYSKNIIDTRGVFKNFKFQDKIDFV